MEMKQKETGTTQTLQNNLPYIDLRANNSWPHRQFRNY